MVFFGAEVRADRVTWIDATPELTIHLTNVSDNPIRYPITGSVYEKTFLTILFLFIIAVMNQACLMSAKKENARVVLQICKEPPQSDTEAMTIALGVLKASKIENIQLNVMVSSKMGLRLAGADSAGAVVHVVGNEFEVSQQQPFGIDSGPERALELASDLADDIAGGLADIGLVLDNANVVMQSVNGHEEQEPDQQGNGIEEFVDFVSGRRRDQGSSKETEKQLVKRKPGALPIISHKSGLRFQDIIIGSGKKVQRGRKVDVQYVLRLENGKVVDRADRRQPFRFRLGIGECVKGFDIGVMGMREGGERHLIVPPELGYGDGRVPGIPKASTLFFDITVLKAF